MSRTSRSLLVVGGLIGVSVAGAFLPLMWPRSGIERSPVSSPLAKEGSAPSIAPDGGRIAWIARGAVVNGAPLEGSTEADRWVSISTGGNKIAVIRGTGEASELCLLPASRCVAKIPNAAGLDWMRDDKHLVAAYGTPPALFLIDAATGASRRLSPEGAADSWPSVSARGRAISFVREGAYWVYEVAGDPPAVRRTRKLAAPKAPVDAAAGWSSDSRFLYFASAGKLWRLGFNGRAVPELLADVDGVRGHVTAARSGRKLVYQSGAGLFLLEGF